MCVYMCICIYTYTCTRAHTHTHANLPATLHSVLARNLRQLEADIHTGRHTIDELRTAEVCAAFAGSSSSRPKQGPSRPRRRVRSLPRAPWRGIGMLGPTKLGPESYMVLHIPEASECILEEREWKRYSGAFWVVHSWGFQLHLEAAWTKCSESYDGALTCTCWR